MYLSLYSPNKCIAIFQDNRTLETNTVNMMTHEPPEFTDDAMNQLTITRDENNATIATIVGDWNSILLDKECKFPKSAYILYKHERMSSWSQELVDVKNDHISQSIFLPEFCLQYRFRIKIIDQLDSEPILSDLNDSLDPIEVNNKIKKLVFVYFVERFISE